MKLENQWELGSIRRLLTSLVMCCGFAAAVVGGDDCVDTDGDGYGNPASTDCDHPELDCDDSNAAVNPGATEVCNGTDDNCDGQADEGFTLSPCNPAETPDDCDYLIAGFESVGVCFGTLTECDLRFPFPPNCTCVPKTHNFSQIVKACVDVDDGTIGDPCDEGDPDEDGSLAFGNECPAGFECRPVPVDLDTACLVGLGVCARLGTVICAGDGLSAVCDEQPGDPQVPVEGDSTTDPATDPLCFDKLDNDCDGLTDHEDEECQTDEICDGFDNDNENGIDDTFPIGQPCEVGQGPCQNEGVYICNAQGTVSCDVNPHPAPQVSETTCGDGIDNDCDGLADCADPTCLITPTLCGIVNVCTGESAPGFDDLSEPCSVGVGACHAEGLLVCSMDKMSLVCSAQPGPAGIERRTFGNSCFDGEDNDCDGFTDMNETECQESTLTVACSLEYSPPPKPAGRGEKGSDCEGWHILDWEVAGNVGETTCTAVLKGLEPDGTVIGVLGPIQERQEAHLNSRLNPDDWKIITRSRTNRGIVTTWHEVFAPVPLLEVTCRDEARTATAYCSNVPYLDVIKPNGSVANGAVADETLVEVAMPRIDPRNLQVLIDCVDIIPQLISDPTELPGGPFSGMVDINGQSMEIKDLYVRSPIPGKQSSVEDLAANTLTMTIVGSGCGGHAIYVQGTAAADFIPTPQGKVTPNCHQDDGTDLGQWSVFQVTVNSPTQGEVVDDGGMRPASVDVQGEVCHGLDIFDVLVQGHAASLSPPMVESLGDGACAGDAKTVTLTFDDTLPVADMELVFAGTQSTRGRFEPGPNMLIAQATDVQGNTTHDLVPFVVGPAIATPAQIAAAMQSVIASHDPDTIHKAFTLVLNNNVTLDNGNSALKEFFDQFIREFATNLANCLVQPREFCCTKHLSMPWYTPDVDVTFCTTPLLEQVPPEAGCESDADCQADSLCKCACDGDAACRFAKTFAITVTPQDGFVTISMRIPTFKVRSTGSGEECTGGCGFFCIARTKVDFDITMTIPDITVEIDISEDNILMQDNEFTLRLIPGDDDNIDIDGLSDNDIETGCGLLSLGTLLWVASCVVSPITCAAYTLIIGLPTLLTNVFVDLMGFVADHKGIDLCPFVRQIQGDDGMKEQSDDVNVCREDLGPSFDLGLEHTLEAVEITTDGIALSIAAKIQPTMTDPNAPPVTNTLSTDAPLLLPGDPNLRSISMAISDDFWNQLFAGMTQAGKLRANFTKVLKLGNYVPVCDDIKPAPGDALFDLKNRRYARCVGMTECNDPSDFDLLDRCQACQDNFPFRTCEGGTEVCTTSADCPGTCEGICTAGQIGQPCLADIGCGIGGTCTRTCDGGPTPGDACTLDAQCRADCVGCAADDDATCARGACNRAARRARDTKINKDTDIVLHARTETPPAMYLVDDPATEDLVEIIFAIPRARAALIASRDGNNDIGGFSLGDGGCDLESMCDPAHPCDVGQLDKLIMSTLPDCAQEGLASNVDCLLWSSCMDLNVKFQIGVKSIAIGPEMRPELEFHLVGLVELPPGVENDQGEQCDGSFEIPDLDHLNREAAENDARKGLERTFCEKTPPMQSCATDFDGSVEFLNPKLFTIKTCTDDGVCDTDFDDYLVITGDLKAQGLGFLVADKVCEKLVEKTSEGTGECPDKEEGEPEDRERERICPKD